MLVLILLLVIVSKASLPVAILVPVPPLRHPTSPVIPTRGGRTAATVLLLLLLLATIAILEATLTGQHVLRLGRIVVAAVHLGVLVPVLGRAKAKRQEVIGAVVQRWAVFVLWRLERVAVAFSGGTHLGVEIMRRPLVGEITRFES
uniref:(northern house mosquito) hypothetical protein n=1 Tax=Culex pipiens TaxID=7175 RepID=A0A8D8AY02_CULPI